MQQARRSERDFTRERALPLQRLVPLLLNFRKGTNRDELEQFFETITDDPTSVTPVSEAAFCRARQKLKPEALVTLNNVLLDSANQQIAQQRWRGLRVLAVDGSTGRLPDFLVIEEYFGKPSGSGVPLARFRCPPWRAKRRRVVPGSREATRDTRRAEGAKGDPKGASERGVQSYGRPVCSRNELAMLWRNAG